MIRVRHLFRLLRINVVLVRHGLDEIVLATRWFRPVRWLVYLTPWHWLRLKAGRQRSQGERIRNALEELGPIFVKFGQILSTRRDLLPHDIAEELSFLQDRVPPFPADQARRIIEESLNAPLATVFEYFEDQPMASASIAQVHGARLHGGRDVVVKVVRPDIEPVIARDLELLELFARLVERYWSLGKRLRPREVVAEFRKSLLDELDLLREASNCSQLRRNFEGSELLYMPDVVFEHTSRRIMVMERVQGIPVSHINELKKRDVNLKLLAERGVEIFFTQVFRDSFFHADMHPGNIFVDATDPANPSWVAVDFGIVGSLGPVDHRYLAQNFLAFFNRDYRRVAELHVESGWVPPDTRVEEFEAAIRTVCEPIFERPLKDISFGAILLRLFETGRRFDMVIQPQLVLLQKTLLNIEGLGRELYPDLDLWSTAKPYMEHWMRKQVGIEGVIRRLRRNLPDWGETLPELPNRLLAASAELGELKHALQEQNKELQGLRRALDAQASSRVLTGLAIALFIMTAVLLVIESGASRLFEPKTIALATLSGGGVAFLLAWLRTRRS